MTFSAIHCFPSLNLWILQLLIVNTCRVTERLRRFVSSERMFVIDFYVLQKLSFVVEFLFQLSRTVSL